MNTSLEPCKEQVHRILHSRTFQSSSTLQQLLQYLTSRVLEGNTDQLKEYTIGVEAFGRSQNFDPKTDTIVRVQIHRLRQKLKEYYDTIGKNDSILVEIPKGHYLPSFETVPAATAANEIASSSDSSAPAVSESVAPNMPEDSQTGIGASFRWILSHAKFQYVPGGIALLAVLSAALLWFTGASVLPRSWTHTGGVKLSKADAADPVKVFWANFLGNDMNPVIGYPDAQFLLDNSNDLFSFPNGASDDRGAPVDEHVAREFATNPELAAKAGTLYYESGYTGAGELQGIAALSALFGRMGIEPTVKPSRDITPSDLKNHNVILLGSSLQNVAVDQLLVSGDFRFHHPTPRNTPGLRLQAWQSQILNSAPRPGESTEYQTERNPQTQVLMVDYSLISIQTDEMSGRHLAVLGGLDTMGTHGAVIYITSRYGAEELSKSLAAFATPASKGEILPFQALLRVRLERGNRVVESKLLALHRLPSAGVPPTPGSTPSGSAAH